jgi:hypothetical protein
MSKNTNKSIKKLKVVEVVEELNSYDAIRAKYADCETIPCHYIQKVMEHHFENFNYILQYSERHGTYTIPIRNVLNANVVNWEYNRPADNTRCEDISSYMYNTKHSIDTLMYLSYNNKLERFEVLDGIHRITALRILKTKYDSNADIDTNWLFNQHILVNIRFNASIGELIEAFKTLNKCQAVPDLYIGNQTKEKRDTIERIVNNWQCKYSNHFSGSKNPKTGNINRNNFVDLLDKIYDKHNISNINGNFSKYRFRRFTYSKNDRSK